MSERVEKKLEEVAVAEFAYRHEAEFAAGFLSDAAIPYRLQIDDPALGMTISAPATIWVRGMDVRRAREVLDLDREDRLQPQRPPHSVRRDDRGSRSDVDRMPALNGRERITSLVGVALLSWLTWYLQERGASGSIVSGSGLFAIVLIAATIAGRAPWLLKRLLAALSGSPP